MATTTKNTALVTGANRGIGLELTRALAARGEHVIAVCRTRSAELDALGVQVEAGVDVADGEALRALGEKLASTPIHTLIANAGILRDEQLGSIDYDAIEQQLRVNALGPLRTVETLLPSLQRGSKVALITSRMGSIADNGSGGHYGYRMSKAALNAAGVSLARDLAPRGVAVVLLHPGYVRTEMTARSGNLEPADSARMLLERIDALTLQTTGSFWHASGEQLAW